MNNSLSKKQNKKEKIIKRKKEKTRWAKDSQNPVGSVSYPPEGKKKKQKKLRDREDDKKGIQKGEMLFCIISLQCLTKVPHKQKIVLLSCRLH